MSCKIIFNQDNTIDKVLNVAGQRSKLFDQIASLPFMNTMEEALSTYKNVYTKALSDIGSTLVSNEGEMKYGKSMSDNIENIVSDMNHPTFKALFSYWKKRGGKIRFYGGRGDNEGIGFYNKKTKEISFNVNHSKFIEHYSSQENVDKVVAHEIIHAIVDDSLSRNPSLEKDFNNELIQYIELAMAHQDQASDYVKSRLYYITQGSPEELLTYSLTDPEVAQFLDTIILDGNKGNTVTIWDKIKNFILGVIGSGNSKTLLDATVETMNNYIGDFRSNSTFYKPAPDVVVAAQEYGQAVGLDYQDFQVTSIDVNNSKEIARLYDEMEHNPTNPEVLAAYTAMMEQTEAQYEFLIGKGYKVEIFKGQGEPYKSSKELVDDLINNKHIYIFSTKEGFGETEVSVEDNPLVAPSKFQDIHGQELLINDLFRAVHDIFGHAKLGNGFGTVGEENAWLSHSSMYSPLARRAMTSETRGQNSWVNFSGANNEALNKIRQGNKLIADGNVTEGQALLKEGQSEFRFAEQKIGLLPEWVSEPDFNLYNQPQDIGAAESPLTFVSDKGNSFDTYKEALVDSTTGDILIGIGEGDTFKELARTSSSTNVNTAEGFTNYYIKAGLLSDVRQIENGQSFLRAAGATVEEQLVNEHIIDEDAKVNLGTGFRQVRRDGKITLSNGKGRVELVTKAGATSSVTFDEIRSMSNEEIQDQFQEADMVMAAKAVNETILSRTFGTPILDESKVQLSEKELVVRLLSLLEKMGVKVTTIAEYQKNSKLRNGVEPSANSLADIANQIVAFKNGEITADALAEETAHFIVEAWNEGDISNLLRNIDSTEEYTQFAETYRDVYTRQGVPASEVEALVRREVLGKVLAKSLVTNFSTEGQTPAQSNIISYIQNLFQQFMDRVSRLFESRFEADLYNFTSQVNDLILNQNIDNYLNVNNFDKKKFVMYQINQPLAGVPAVDTLVRQSKGLLQMLQQQERDLLRAGKGLKSNVKKLKELEQQLDTAVVTDSITQLLLTAKRQTQYISQAADIANKNGTFLTSEEGVVWYSLKESMAPALAEMGSYLTKQNNPNNRPLIEEIDALAVDVARITGKLINQDSKVVNSIIDRMMVRHNLPDSARDMLEQATKSALHDTTAFYATFGQLSHAKDPILNLAGSVIHDLTFDANISWLRETKPFQQRIAELGFTEKDLKQFFDRGYILDVRDWAAFEEKEAEISSRILHEVSGKLTPEIIRDLKRNPKSHKGETLPQLNSAESTEYSKRYRTEMAPYLETVFDNEYYKKEEAKYIKYGISDITVRERKDLSTDRGVLLSRVKDVGGRVRFTAQDKIDLNALNIKRKKLKSLYTEFGLVKPGLLITPGTLPNKVDVNNPNIIEVNGNIVEIDKANASDEAIKAFDLNKLDIIYAEEVATPGTRTTPTQLSDEFLSELQFIETTEGREEALEFFRLNSSINFSEEYWNSLGESNGVLARLEAIPDSEDLRERMQHLVTKRKQIIKQYQSQQDASDILVSEMPKDVKQEVLNLTDAIDAMFLEASRMLNDNRSDEEIVSVSENTPNEAYYSATNGMNTQEKLQFILNNTSNTNQRRIREFNYSVDDARSKGKALSKVKQAIYDRFNMGDDELTKLKYAESKLAPYYNRFAPVGFSEFQKRLEGGNESVHNIVQQMNQDPSLQIVNNFSYYKAEDQAYRNKNFKPDFEGGYFQPKISEFKNQKFEELFAPTIVDGEVVSVGKNQQLYDLYQEMLNYQRNNLAAMGELGSHNLYKAPQISKTGLNKFTDLVTKKNKGATIKESIKDFLFYRVDDQAYGAEINGESAIKTLGARYIPKYYLRDLEQKEDVSDDLFFSLTAFAQQAYLYKSRKNYFSDMMAIQESLLNRQYPEGKAAESTSTVKMFRSAMDAYLFGVQESKQLRVTLPVIGTVDLTKNIRFFHKWILNRNLGFNLVVPFTSWVTAESQTMIEKYIGEYINTHSTGLAAKEFLSLSTDAFKETLELNSKAKLNVLLEHLGIYNAEERYRNSQYSKTMRAIPKIGMALNNAANFPIIPRVALTVLYDYRVVGDNIINFNQFEQIEKDAGTPANDIVTKWKTLEEKALYNYMNVDETSVRYDIPKLMADTNTQMGEAEFEAFMAEKEKGVTSRIREMVKFVDGQIPSYEKSLAQRHFFLSFFTTHRGWLAIAYARRFKNKHLNLQTGQTEQGSYRSMANFISDNFGELYKGKFKDFLKNVKTQWAEADDIERANIRRVLIELAFLQAMVAIGWGISAMADDDDNKDLYALQLTNYLYFRLLNETTSSQTAIGGQFYDLVKSPIVGADTLKSIVSFQNYFDTDTIQSGRYAGMYKYQKQLMSVVPGYKSYIDLANPKDAYSSYKHFNPATENHWYNPINFILETADEK